MEKEYPFIVGEEDGSLIYEKCKMCSADAMMGFEGEGFCGQHYAEGMGWAVPTIPVTIEGVTLPIAREVEEPVDSVRMVCTNTLAGEVATT